MTATYEDAGLRLWHGSNKDILPTIAADTYDSVVTDPPYELAFMGKGWDGSGIAFDVGLWREVYRVLKPGGHLLAFGGTRTWHRLAVAIEDAGFEIRDSIAWLYGTGFPKSMDVSKAIDATIVHGGSHSTHIRATNESRPGEGRMGGPKPINGIMSERKAEAHVTRDQAQTPEGDQWSGWGTALKPAFEPIVVARKPLGEKTVATNVLKYGTGALNIDATRIGSESRTNPAAGNKPGGASLNMSLAGMPSGVASTEAIGRWPANVALDESQAEVLDALTDAASRFFYVAKAPKSERPIVDGVAHPTVKPLDLMRWLIRLVTRPGSHVLDPFAGSGTTGEAALLEGMNVDLIELEATHIPLIIARVRKPIQPAMFGDWDNSMNTQTEDLA